MEDLKRSSTKFDFKKKDRLIDELTKLEERIIHSAKSFELLTEAYKTRPDPQDLRRLEQQILQSYCSGLLLARSGLSGVPSFFCDWQKNRII